MHHTDPTVNAIQEMVRFFIPRCTEQSTLRELDAMCADEGQWKHAHALFRRIRAKTLQADETKDKLLRSQYSFEEVCAKTLYNISGHVKGGEFPYEFDNDSPLWVIPNAVKFARSLGVENPFCVSSMLWWGDPNRDNARAADEMNRRREPKLCFTVPFEGRFAQEAEDRGYWSGSYVEFDDGVRHPVVFWDAFRLGQDLETEAEHGRPYIAERGLVVVQSVTLEKMQLAVERLAKEGFFDRP